MAEQKPSYTGISWKSNVLHYFSLCHLELLVKTIIKLGGSIKVYSEQSGKEITLHKCRILLRAAGIFHFLKGQKGK